MTKSISVSQFLRTVLVVDAIMAVAAGLITAAAPTWWAQILSLPSTLLQSAGLFLIIYGTFVFWLSIRKSIPTFILGTLIVANVLWVGGSLFLLISPWFAPSALGSGFVLVQGLFSLTVADLIFIGRRRAMRMHASIA